MKDSPDFFELSFINIDLDGKTVNVQVCDYVSAKTKDLIEFGYSTLTEEAVTKSVRRIVNGEKATDIIDHFIKSDIILP
jgi:hypothetical protein